MGAIYKSSVSRIHTTCGVCLLLVCDTICLRYYEIIYVFFLLAPIVCLILAGQTQLKSDRQRGIFLFYLKAFECRKGVKSDSTACLKTSESVCNKAIKEYIKLFGQLLEMLTRYWVARYCAYPVMWTLAQECDNDMYDELHPGNLWWNYKNNPWVTVAEYIHKYDPYQRPLSGHQESAIWTTITGEGAYFSKKSNGGRSVFADEDVSERCGHSWWATQWKHPVYKLPHALSAKEYWNSPKVAINYEDFYCNLWTNNFGARSRAWISILSGLFGYGYGAADIWLYKGGFEMDRDAVRMDGYSTITIAEKNIPWSESVELESAYQVGYMKNFFESFEWWRLVPDFDNKVYFCPEDDATLYACATVDNSIYVIYLYGNDLKCGMVGNLEGEKEYSFRWYNPRTNEYKEEVIIKANTTDLNGKPAYLITSKPDEEDWVALITKKQ